VKRKKLLKRKGNLRGHKRELEHASGLFHVHETFFPKRSVRLSEGNKGHQVVGVGPGRGDKPEALQKKGGVGGGGNEKHHLCDGQGAL